MKTLVLFFVLVPLSSVSAFTQAFKGKVPSHCQSVFDRSYGDLNNPVQSETVKALAMAIRLTKEIMDLKFQTHAFMQENLSLYGEYVKQLEIKKNLDESKKSVEKHKQHMMTESDQKLEMLLKIQTELAKTMYRDVIDERDNEMIIYNNRLWRLEKEWNKKKNNYYWAVKAWSPYENRLQALDKVEIALQNSLRNLEEMHRSTGTSFADLMNVLNSWRAEDADQTCEALDQKLAEMIAKIQ